MSIILRDLRAEDSLAFVCEILQEEDNVPCTLGVKARGWLVQKEQEFGLAEHLSKLEPP